MGHNISWLNPIASTHCAPQQSLHQNLRSFKSSVIVVLVPLDVNLTSWIVPASSDRHWQFVVAVMQIL
jgi:hypothetical protein